MTTTLLTREASRRSETGAVVPQRTGVPAASVHRVTRLSDLHGALGNRTLQQRASGCSAFSACPTGGACHACPFRVQAKLTINQPGDVYEQEADRVADAVLRMPESRPAEIQATPPQIGRACAACEDDELIQTQEEAGHNQQGEWPVETAVAGLHGGQPLDPATRAFFEPRFGRDLSQVRVHTYAPAAASAQALRARAFTIGHDVVFAPGQYAPAAPEGRRLLAHELTHVIQQEGRHDDAALMSDTRHEPSEIIGASVMIARELDPSMCASDCAASDGSGRPTGRYLLTVFADKEGPFLLIPLTLGVGHSWIELVDSTGTSWTYGFWPQRGFDASDPTKSVDGCVHHPDTLHRPTASQTFELTAAEFAAAKTKATAMCHARPDYNLFGLQCTEFVRQVLEAAGQAPGLGFGLIWESPNALHSWIRGNSLLLGVTVTGATSAAGGAGAGSVGLSLLYRHQFLSALGNKLRLDWTSRGEFSSRIASASTGIGLEITGQRVYLPTIYLFGGGILGELTPTPLAGGGQTFGAGLTGGAGLLFNIDELASVGVEYNVVKDLVNEDPTLHRLMISAGLRF